ncbi:MAG: hypothetical protein R3C28_02045 [Pirellulaceae bacterium]
MKYSSLIRLVVVGCLMHGGVSFCWSDEASDDVVLERSQRATWHNLVSVAIQPKAEAELEILQDQKLQIEKIRAEFRKYLQEAPNDVSFLDRWHTAYAAAEEELGQVLLPRQMEQLRTLTLQSRLKHNGMTALVQSWDIFPQIKELSLTAEQKTEIEENYQSAKEEFKLEKIKLTKEYNEALDALEKQYEEKMFEPLSEDAQKLLRGLLEPND